MFDVYSQLQQVPGWEEELLRPDGLHLSHAGQVKWFHDMIRVINKELPDMR